MAQNQMNVLRTVCLSVGLCWFAPCIKFFFLYLILFCFRLHVFFCCVSSLRCFNKSIYYYIFFFRVFCEGTVKPKQVDVLATNQYTKLSFLSRSTHTHTRTKCVRRTLFFALHFRSIPRFVETSSSITYWCLVCLQAGMTHT